jgi:hypothetical protein
MEIPMLRPFALLLALGVLVTAGSPLSAEPPAGAPPAQPVQPAQPAAPAKPVLSVTVPTYINTTCPIMAKPASKAMWADTAKGRIYVCCPPCIAKILKDPERAYAAAYPVAKKAGNTVCPITDKPLGADAVTVTLQGYEVGVCATCAEKAKTNHQITLAKALDPKIVEIRNETCPITSQPVATNAFCVIGTELVHLSSPKVVEDVKKDPAKALQAAKDIVAKQQAAAATGAGAGKTAK